MLADVTTKGTFTLVDGSKSLAAVKQMGYAEKLVMIQPDEVPDSNQLYLRTPRRGSDSSGLSGQKCFG